jgi:hypothetical protein
MLETMGENVIKDAQATRTRSETDDRDRISVGWTVAYICVLLALLVAVNLLPEGMGASLTRTESGQWLWRPALEVSPSWLSTWLGLTLALQLVNLYCRRWQPATRWADLGLAILAVFVLLQLFRGFLPHVSSIRVVLEPGGAATPLAWLAQNPSSWPMLAAYVVLPIALLCTLWQSARKLLVLARL